MTQTYAWTEVAHIIPPSEKEWYEEYGLQARFGAFDGPANAMLLRADVHKSWSNKTFTFLPRQAGEYGEKTLVAYVLDTTCAKEIIRLYHNVRLQPLSGIPMEFLLARFAWTIFDKVKFFMTSHIRKWLWVADRDGNYSSRSCPSHSCRILLQRKLSCLEYYDTRISYESIHFPDEPTDTSDESTDTPDQPTDTPDQPTDTPDQGASADRQHDWWHTVVDTVGSPGPTIRSEAQFEDAVSEEDASAIRENQHLSDEDDDNAEDTGPDLPPSSETASESLVNTVEEERPYIFDGGYLSDGNEANEEDRSPDLSPTPEVEAESPETTVSEQLRAIVEWPPSNRREDQRPDYSRISEVPESSYQEGETEIQGEFHSRHEGYDHEQPGEVGEHEHHDDEHKHRHRHEVDEHRQHNQVNEHGHREGGHEYGYPIGVDAHRPRDEEQGHGQYDQVDEHEQHDEDFEEDDDDDGNDNDEEYEEEGEGEEYGDEDDDDDNEDEQHGEVHEHGQQGEVNEHRQPIGQPSEHSGHDGGIDQHYEQSRHGGRPEVAVHRDNRHEYGNGNGHGHGYIPLPGYYYACVPIPIPGLNHGHGYGFGYGYGGYGYEHEYYAEDLHNEEMRRGPKRLRTGDADTAYAYYYIPVPPPTATAPPPAPVPPPTSPAASPPPPSTPPPPPPHSPTFLHPDPYGRVRSPRACSCSLCREASGGRAPPCVRVCGRG